jgi:hypothetical protein
LKNYEIEYYSYNIEEFPFAEIVKNLFEVSDLTKIHDTLENKKSELFTKNNDDTTELHSKFYQKLNSGWPEFEETYENMIRKISKEVFKQDSIIYQTKPTFRVQLPDNVAVGGEEGDAMEKYGWHRDTDKGYNHPPFENNFIIPLTDAKETASIYIETYPGSNEFKSADMKVGEFFKFMGGECIHGNKPNKTGRSRVSIDFRIVLKNDYDKSFIKSSMQTGKKFILGEYYSIL